MQALNFSDRVILFFMLVFLLLFFAVSFFIPVFLLVIVSAALWLFVMLVFVLLLADKRIDGHAKRSKKNPGITIVIPAYNSMGTIKRCLDAVKKIKYAGKLEVIVVEDCCTDGTREYLEKIKWIRLVKMKKNSGCKAIPLNKGISLAKTPFVACIDSDTYPEPEIFNKLLGYFDDDLVGAVGSLILPDANKSMIQKMQFFEYSVGLGLWASALSSINSRITMSGAMVVLRKSALEKIGGGFDVGNLTEDMEMVMRMQKFGYKIKTCFEAVAFTDVPNTLKNVVVQRERWFRGRIFNLMKYKKLFFSTSNFDLGFFGLPYMFFLELMSVVLLARVALLVVIDAAKFVMVEKTVFDASSSFGYLSPTLPFISPVLLIMLVSYFFMFLYYYLALRAIKYWPRGKDFVAILINILLYPYLIGFIYVESFIKEMLGAGSKWVRVST